MAEAGSAQQHQVADKDHRAFGPVRPLKDLSNGDVTIVLPITEDCTADGAVCTGDTTKNYPTGWKSSSPAPTDRPIWPRAHRQATRHTGVQEAVAN